MNIQKLIDAYEQRLDAYMKQLEESCSPKRGEKAKEIPVSPSYLEEVLIPTFKALAEMMPRGYSKPKVPDLKTYRPIKEYYRIKIGLKTVGGFLVPDGDSFDLYFVPLKSAQPIGEKVRIESIEQLKDLIIEWINKK